MVSKMKMLIRMQLNIQDRVSDEEEEQAGEHDSKTAQIDHSSLSEDVAVALVFFTGLWVVQSVIRFYVFWEQQ